MPTRLRVAFSLGLAVLGWQLQHEALKGGHGSPHHKGILLPRKLSCPVGAAAQTRADAMATRGSQGAGAQNAPVPARHLEKLC